MNSYNILSTRRLLPAIVDSAMQKGIDIMEQEFISVQPITNTATKKTVQSAWLPEHFKISESS